MLNTLLSPYHVFGPRCVAELAVCHVMFPIVCLPAASVATALGRMQSLLGCCEAIITSAHLILSST